MFTHCMTKLVCKNARSALFIKRHQIIALDFAIKTHAPFWLDWQLYYMSLHDDICSIFFQTHNTHPPSHISYHQISCSPQELCVPVNMFINSYLFLAKSYLKMYFWNGYNGKNNNRIYIHVIVLNFIFLIS